jgi:hypothetical protein
MQPQAAEALCVQIRIGRPKLVSLPSEFVPKRINWAKWADGVSASLRVKKNRFNASSRLCLSPDHQDSKDNLAVLSSQSQSSIDKIDFLKLISSVSEDTKFLFVGSWPQNLPSWFKSLQAVFTAKYASIMQDELGRQIKFWSSLSERLEANENFLVIDDVGRLSALSAISKNWRSRQLRANILQEVRSSSWFASTVDIHMSRSSEGESLRLHRLLVLPPEQWCGAPTFVASLEQLGSGCKAAPEIWVSAPGAGMSLWIAEHHHRWGDGTSGLRLPSAILGWHPLRDMLAFLAEAPSGSLLFMVDSDTNLQVLLKENGDQI